MGGVSSLLSFLSFSLILSLFISFETVMCTEALKPVSVLSARLLLATLYLSHKRALCPPRATTFSALPQFPPHICAYLTHSGHHRELRTRGPGALCSSSRLLLAGWGMRARSVLPWAFKAWSHVLQTLRGWDVAQLWVGGCFGGDSSKPTAVRFAHIGSSSITTQLSGRSFQPSMWQFSFYFIIFFPSVYVFVCIFMFCCKCVHSSSLQGRFLFRRLVCHAHTTSQHLFHATAGVVLFCLHDSGVVVGACYTISDFQIRSTQTYCWSVGYLL